MRGEIEWFLDRVHGKNCYFFRARLRRSRSFFSGFIGTRTKYEAFTREPLRVAHFQLSLSEWGSLVTQIWQELSDFRSYTRKPSKTVLARDFGARYIFTFTECFWRARAIVRLAHFSFLKLCAQRRTQMEVSVKFPRFLACIYRKRVLFRSRLRRS